MALRSECGSDLFRRWQRERELINRALSTTTLERTEPVPELKPVAPPSVSAADLEKARLTGAEIAARKAEEAKAAAIAEKEAKKVSTSGCASSTLASFGVVGRRPVHFACKLTPAARRPAPR